MSGRELHRIGEALAAQDPVPEEVTRQAKAAFARRGTVDSSLPLREDQDEAGDPPGRLLVFGDDSLTVRLHLVRHGAAYDARCILQSSRGDAQTVTAEFGHDLRVDAEADRGGYRWTGLQPGPTRIRLDMADPPVHLATDWLVI